MSKEGTDGNGPQRSLTPVSMTEEELAKAEGDVGPVRYVTNYVNRDQGLVGSVIHTEVNVSYDTQGDIPSSTVLEVITTAVGSAPAPKPGTVVITKAKQGQLPEGWKTFRRMSTVRILSSKLINALRAVVDYYPGQNLLGDTVEIQEPYRFLILHRDQLEKYKSQHPPQHDEAYKLECNRHIDELLKFLDTAMSKKVTEEEQRYSRGVATFENLWLLLKPGERVFIRGSHGRIMPALLHDIKGGWVDGHTEPYRLTLWSIIYNGIVFTRWYQKARLIPFDGEKEIMSLRIYPQNRHVDSDSQLAAHDGRTLQEQMVIWGAKTWGLAKPCLREYHGLTIPVSNEQRRLSRVEGRVMVDFESWIRDKISREVAQGRRADSESEVSDSSDDEVRRPRPSKLRSRTRRDVDRGWCCECDKCIEREDVPRGNTYREYDDVDPAVVPGNRDHFFSLMDRDVLAFALKERKFVVLDIEGIKDPTFDPDIFNYLVLTKKVKDIVRKLTMNPEVDDQSTPEGNQTQLRQGRKDSGMKFMESSFSPDFIKGKGEGQVFLLHGPPGVGKTCTAECVAEQTRRPLLAITSGDLGVTAVELEENLGNFLRLGEHWGAIVLLDEADIYFEERGRNDIKRNSLVSVLLRALEYYRGILFLTTNRPGVVDDAFMSRIHVPLFFSDLSDEDRTTIWNNNFFRLQEQNPDIKVNKFAQLYIEKDPTLKALKWNGREIRNAFKTVVALAKAEADKGQTVEIKQEHVKEVVSLSKNFKEYMSKVHKNQSVNQRASRKGLRAYIGEDDSRSDGIAKSDS